MASQDDPYATTAADPFGSEATLEDQTTEVTLLPELIPINTTGIMNTTRVDITPASDAAAYCYGPTLATAVCLVILTIVVLVTVPAAAYYYFYVNFRRRPGDSFGDIYTNAGMIATRGTLGTGTNLGTGTGIMTFVGPGTGAVEEADGQQDGRWAPGQTRAIKSGEARKLMAKQTLQFFSPVVTMPRTQASPGGAFSEVFDSTGRSPTSPDPSIQLPAMSHLFGPGVSGSNLQPRERSKSKSKSKLKSKQLNSNKQASKQAHPLPSVPSSSNQATGNPSASATNPVVSYNPTVRR